MQKGTFYYPEVLNTVKSEGKYNYSNNKNNKGYFLFLM